MHWLSVAALRVPFILKKVALVSPALNIKERNIIMLGECLI